MCTWSPLYRDGIAVIKFTKSRKVPLHFFQCTATRRYPYTFANGVWKVALKGWTHTRAYAAGFLSNNNVNPTAVVSGLTPGVVYTYKIYQYAHYYVHTPV